MKSTLLWSLTALCGVVGGVVAWNGGWRSISPTWTPIRITKVVWVTNEVSHGAVSSPWYEPLKPLESEQTFDQRAWMTNDYGHRIPNNQFWMTNTVTIKNETDTPSTVNYANSTNYFTVKPGYITNMLFVSSNMVMYATNHYGF